MFAGCVAGREAAPAAPPATRELARAQEEAVAREVVVAETSEASDVSAPSEVSEASEAPAVEEADTGETRAVNGRVPTVRVSPVTVGPKHSPEVIRRVVLQYRADFKRCRVVAGEPQEVVFRFTIGAGGVVVAAEARDAGGEPSTAPEHVCAAGVLRSLKFPVDMAGITVSYPWR